MTSSRVDLSLIIDLTILPPRQFSNGTLTLAFSKRFTPVKAFQYLIDEQNTFIQTEPFVIDRQKKF